ncbi:PAC2 family protein [Galbitalea sp. SE-J8]|uniref:PAC2 family protein n=1 Tax=Galbitalea sp. SE-J8 TaxID=3054952 RepID=UPI00259C81A7|nr:PAC2 family protein [Galbitalea sp. SE-J8]MDM4764020.1 PAC2 family protein [Galbitalea sp. SE-J8]
MGSQSAFVTGRLLVVAFEGWNDAGEAASAAASALKAQLELEPLLAIDPEDYFDYQFTRPMVQIDESGRREIVWPSVTLWGPASARSAFGVAPEAPGEAAPIYLLLGSEPSRGWKTFALEVMDAVETAGIDGIVFLGALLADVPHSRPITTFVTSETAEVRERLGVERSSYEGPTGILGVLSDAADKLGIPTVSVWASVPHYVHNAPSPKATLALIDKLEELVDIVIPRGELLDEATAWESGIDALAQDDEDMANYIEQLEKARDTVDSPEASGEAIAQEFEQYLRRNTDGKDGGTAGDEPWRPSGE